MAKLHLITYGCQMNEYDSERVAGLLREHDYELTDDAAAADLILINTCAIREKAEDKVFSRLGELKPLKAANPGLLIGVMGCMAPLQNQNVFRRAPHVDLVFGSPAIAKVGELVERARRERRPVLETGEAPLVKLTAKAPTAERLRAFVTVMEGCEKHCTFCVVPRTRGRERSHSPESIVAEVRGLVADGCREVTLLGQTVNAYGRDLTPATDLAELFERSTRSTASRDPLHHLEPLQPHAQADRAMRDVPKVCEYFHLPLQSGSDRVLERMNRGYTRARYLELIDELRDAEPAIALSTDLIVGFPGETEADFEQTLAVVEQRGLRQRLRVPVLAAPGHAGRRHARAGARARQGRAQRARARGGDPASAPRAGSRRLARAARGSAGGRRVAQERAELSGRTRCNRVVNFERQGASRRRRHRPTSASAEVLPHSLRGHGAWPSPEEGRYVGRDEGPRTGARSVSNMPDHHPARRGGQALVAHLGRGSSRPTPSRCELEKIATPRPMTHDLIKNILESLDAQVARIVVTDLKENTFFAVLHLQLGNTEYTVDSRPSDAIALALRVAAPIFVDEDVLRQGRARWKVAKEGEPMKADDPEQAAGMAARTSNPRISRSTTRPERGPVTAGADRALHQQLSAVLRRRHHLGRDSPARTGVRRHEVWVFAPSLSAARSTRRRASYASVGPGRPPIPEFTLAVPWAPRFARLVQSLDLDVYHAHHPFLLGPAARRWPGGLGRPLVFTYHTRYEKYAHYVPLDASARRGRRGPASTRFASRADAGGRALSMHRARTPAPARRDDADRVVPTGVDLERFRPGDRAAARRALGLGLERTACCSTWAVSTARRAWTACSLAFDADRRHGGARPSVLVGQGRKARRSAPAERLPTGDRIHFAGVREHEADCRRVPGGRPVPLRLRDGDAGPRAGRGRARAACPRWP